MEISGIGSHQYDAIKKSIHSYPCYPDPLRAVVPVFVDRLQTWPLLYDLAEVAHFSPLLTFNLSWLRHLFWPIDVVKVVSHQVQA